MELFSHTPIVSLIGIEYMVLFSSIVIRLVIKDSYTYKKINRERREFDRGEKSRKIRLLLPYSALKENCYAPRHIFPVFAQDKLVARFCRNPLIYRKYMAATISKHCK